MGSEMQQRLLAWAGGCAALVPHHHTNELGQAHPDPGRPVRTVGVLASQHNFPPAALLGEVRAACTRLGVELSLRVSPDGAGRGLDRAAQLAEDEVLADQARHHEALRGVDVALVWPRDERSFFHSALRPSTRLVTWWSHGVPTIFYPCACRHSNLAAASPGECADPVFAPVHRAP